MADALGDILSGRTRSNEPPEFDVIKRFVQKKFNIIPKLSVQRGNIVISMPNSAAAGSLRLEIHMLQAQLSTSKKLLIRIG
jgi:hypothetical protein